MRVAIVDIGSNTIKLLVATRSDSHGIQTLHYAVEEARLGGGLAGEQPMLSEAAMDRALAAVDRLVQQAHALSASVVAIVATSAVRDCVNGADFCDQVRTATTYRVRILTGSEEAAYIGRGLAADPALAGAQDFYLFDLGGGSLECLEFRQRRPVQSTSLPLGCVRLTSRCVADTDTVFGPEDRHAVAGIVRETFGKVSDAAFNFTLPRPAVAVVTGGTGSASVAMIAAMSEPATQSTHLSVAAIESLLLRCAGLPLAERRRLPGLPPGRADVFPAALVTLLEIAKLGGIENFTHSTYNLRYGLADEMLG